MGAVGIHDYSHVHQRLLSNINPIDQSALLKVVNSEQIFSWLDVAQRKLTGRVQSGFRHLRLLICRQQLHRKVIQVIRGIICVVNSSAHFSFGSVRRPDYWQIKTANQRQNERLEYQSAELHQ